jgi:hypothetical protein
MKQVKKPSRIDELHNQLLEGKPVQGVTEFHKLCNDLMAEYINVLAGDDPLAFKKALKLRDQLRTAVIYLNYRPTDKGMNPKEVPVEHMRWAMMHPLQGGSFLTKEQGQRVDSPIKGIRAFCLNCQGNDNAGVRECAAINCQFWPFRMGTNVFFGRLAASEQEMTDEQVEQEEEEFENADQAPLPENS